MKKFLSEFKEFALRGNVMDLAVGVIIGAAFQAIINSLVNDVLSPLIGLFAKTDLTYLHFTINEVDIKYGSFLTAIINFIIMVFVIFLLVKGMNALASLGRRKEVEEEPEPTTKICPFCQSEIDINATRCPHCTSELPEEEEDGEAEVKAAEAAND
jgi:large conductance mechanosensitive channel